MDEEALLASILDEPENEVCRLVYADWLQENGQDDRAEFLRESIRPSPSVPPARRQELLSTEAQRWADRFGLDPEAFEFDRGFPYRITFLPAQFVEHAAELFRLAPVREWKLSGNAICHPPPPIRWDTETFRRLAEAPELGRLTLLDLEDGHADEEVLGPLLGSSHLKRLEILVLGWNRLGSGDGAALLGDATLPALRRLDLCGNGIDPEGFRQIRENDFWMNLRTAVLGYNPIGSDGLRILFDVWPPPVALTDLDLSNIGASDDGWNEFADSPLADGVRRLNLTANLLATEGVRSIAHGNFTRLEALEMVNCGVTPRAASFLALSSFAGSLESLNLDNEWEASPQTGEEENQIGDEGLTALAQGRFEKLTELLLMSNGITSASVRQLMDSSLMATLTGLNLNSNQIGDAGAVVLANAPASRGLINLGLCQAGLTDSGARALLESPHLERLQSLRIDGNSISADLLAQLRERFPLKA